MRCSSANQLESSRCAARRRVGSIGRQVIVAKFKSGEEAVSRAADIRKGLEESKLPPEAAAKLVEVFPPWREITLIREELASLATVVATKEDFAKLFAKLATKEDFAKLGTKDDFAKLATKEDFAKLATKEDFAKLATKEDFAKLATKEEVAKLATMDWSMMIGMALGTAVGAAIMAVLNEVK